jgi:hypothetical protein
MAETRITVRIDSCGKPLPAKEFTRMVNSIARTLSARGAVRVQLVVSDVSIVGIVPEGTPSAGERWIETDRKTDGKENDR